MNGNLGAKVRPSLQGNRSSMVTLINSTATAISENSKAHHLPYKLLFNPKFPPTDQALLDCLKNRLHDLSDDEMKKYLDFCFLDPQKLPNARDDGGIYCLIKLSKVKDGGKNFNRETKEGKWVISQKAISVNIKGNNGEKVQLGIKTPLFYLCKDKEQSDRWLMKQYMLHQSQWPPGKEKECEKLALCHIYLKHSSKNQNVHNGSSSSITSGAEPSQNDPVLSVPQELQSTSLLGGGQIVANFCFPNSMDSNLYDLDFSEPIWQWAASVISESESQFWNRNFTNPHS